MKIQVTQQHIDNGYANYPTCCPIALAIKDAVRPNTAVRVYGYVAYINADVADLSPVATKFVESFDNGEPVKPFAFNAKLRYGTESFWRR